jgi:hypothetical protein
MKHSFKAVAALLLVASMCHAQEQPLAGVVFANAVGIEGNTDITANGKRLTRKGLEPGMATSGLGVPIGKYSLQITALGCEPANLPVTVAVGATPVVTAYLERRVDPKTNTPKDFIRVLQLPSEPQESKYLIKVIYLGQTAGFAPSADGQLLQNLVPVTFENKTVKITDSSGGMVDARVSEKGSYYCFVFRKVDGKAGISLVPQRIYRW